MQPPQTIANLPEFHSSAQRVHDFEHLLSRWKSIAGRMDISLERLSLPQEHPVIFLKAPAFEPSEGVYVSAGIHGDEPAGVEALTLWAETQGAALAEMPLLLFPCLNPWGLLQNCRFGENFKDLNRAWDMADHALAQEMRRILRGHRYRLALTLHEDYDARGLYLYEVLGETAPPWGDELIRMSRHIIPPDDRADIEGRAAAEGVVRAKMSELDLEEVPPLPEALYLACNHAERVYTTETPSEFDLARRVHCQIVLLEECLRRAF